MCPIQTSTRRGFSFRTWLVEGDLVTFQPFPTAKAQKGIQRGGERAEGAPDLHVSVCSVFQWPGDGESWRGGGSRGGMAEPIPLISASDVGRFLGMWERSRDPPERGRVRTLVRHRMRTPDPALPEDAQNVNKLAHVLREVHSSIERGSNSTTDEQRAKETESTRASTQEDGGQVHLMENEIDIYETDLAESMAIWGFGEDEHMFFQCAFLSLQRSSGCA